MCVGVCVFTSLTRNQYDTNARRNERLIWLDGALERDMLVSQTVRFGVDRTEACSILRRWCANPVVPPLRRAPVGSGGVEAGGTTASAETHAPVFDQLELVDTGEVVRLVASVVEARIDAVMRARDFQSHFRDVRSSRMRQNSPVTRNPPSSPKPGENAIRGLHEAAPG